MNYLSALTVFTDSSYCHHRRGIFVIAIAEAFASIFTSGIHKIISIHVK